MKIKAAIHSAEEGGYRAEMPALPGCATQGETFERLPQNIYAAVEVCLSVDDFDAGTGETVMEIAV